ncbi:MAG: response regulator [Nitrospirae bacterium]|nr:MAG: response regulator [Nitrospirota bacterium]
MANPILQKVLIVDDDPVSRKKLHRILQRLGIPQIEETNRGDEAFARLQAEPADLVLTDWYMPGLTGLELLHAIRTDERTKHMLVFLVTVEGRRGQILEAIQAGANGYIIKPFSQDSIRQKLEAWLPQQGDSRAPEPGSSNQGKAALEPASKPISEPASAVTEPHASPAQA